MSFNMNKRFFFFLLFANSIHRLPPWRMLYAMTRFYRLHMYRGNKEFIAIFQAQNQVPTAIAQRC